MKQQRIESPDAYAEGAFWDLANEWLDRTGTPASANCRPNWNSNSERVEREFELLLDALPLLSELPPTSFEGKGRLNAREGWGRGRRSKSSSLRTACAFAALAIFLLIARSGFGSEESVNLSGLAPQATVSNTNPGRIMDWSISNRVEGPEGFTESILDQAGQLKTAVVTGSRNPNILAARVMTRRTNTRTEARMITQKGTMTR